MTVHLRIFGGQMAKVQANGFKTRASASVKAILLLSIVLAFASQPALPQNQASLPQTTTGTGSIRGKVTDENGKPVGGAKVFVSFALPSGDPKVVPYPTGQGAKSTFTANNGTFTAARMAPGNYVLCAQTLQSGLLDPCHWAGTPTTFTLAAGQDLSGLSVVMKSGGILHITLSDSKKLLPPSSGPFGNDVRISLVSPYGLIYGIRIASRSDNAREHEITLPYGVQCTLRIESGAFTVLDNNNQAINLSLHEVPVKLSAGAPPTTIAFTITGTH
jgi:hypothetical protein